LQTKGNDVKAERVKNRFLGIEVKHQTVLDLFPRHNEDVTKLVGVHKDSFFEKQVTSGDTLVLTRKKWHQWYILLEKVVSL